MLDAMDGRGNDRHFWIEPLIERHNTRERLHMKGITVSVAGYIRTETSYRWGPK